MRKYFFVKECLYFHYWLVLHQIFDTPQLQNVATAYKHATY